MQLLKRTLFVLTILLLISGCCSNSNRPKTFYDKFSEDWDLDIIPLIEPYRLESSNNGQTWILRADDGLGIGNINEFGVSKTFIFGRDNNSWFLYDIKTNLYASYKTKEDLIKCLNFFNIPVTPIKSCSNYQDDMSKTGKCYWFPAAGQKYNDELELKPKYIVELTAFNNNNSDVGFKAPSSIKAQENNIYFFKLNIQDKNNDLLYFGINLKSSILIKDSAIVPVFIETKSFDITLYTPFPIAQKKGIPEDKRIHIQKTVKIIKG